MRNPHMAKSVSTQKLHGNYSNVRVMDYRNPYIVQSLPYKIFLVLYFLDNLRNISVSHLTQENEILFCT